MFRRSWYILRIEKRNRAPNSGVVMHCYSSPVRATFPLVSHILHASRSKFSLSMRLPGGKSMSVSITKFHTLTKGLRPSEPLSKHHCHFLIPLVTQVPHCNLVISRMLTQDSQFQRHCQLSSPAELELSEPVYHSLIQQHLTASSWSPKAGLLGGRALVQHRAKAIWFD